MAESGPIFFMVMLFVCVFEHKEVIHIDDADK